MNADQTVVLDDDHEVAPEPTSARRKRHVANTLRAIARFIPSLLLVPALVLLVQCAIRMFRYTKTGLDLSDEGLYLIAATRQQKTDNILGAWGNFTHIMLVLSGNSVAVFRFVGFLLLIGAGAATGAALVYSMRDLPRVRGADAADIVPLPRSELLAGAILGGSLLPIYYSLFLVTPGYNWESLFGACIGLAVLLKWLNEPLGKGWREVALWVIVAFDALVSFIARPGTGLAVVSGVLVVTVVRVIRSRRDGRSELIKRIATDVAGAVAASIIFFLTVSSPQVIIESVHREETYALYSNETTRNVIIGAYNGLRAFFPTGFAPAAPYLGFAAIPLLIAAGMRLAPRTFRHKALTVLCELGYLVLFVVLVINLRREGYLVGGPNIFAILPRASIIGLYVAIGIWISRRLLSLAADERGEVGTRMPGAVRVFVIVLIVIGMMYIFGFTSNNGIVEESALSSGLAWLMSALLVASALRWRYSRIVGMAVLSLLFSCVIGWIINDGANSPYRTYPVSEDTTSVAFHIGSSTTSLSLTPTQAQFVRGIQRAAAKSGFRPGTPVEDLTPGGGWAFTPGIVFVLEGEAPTTLMPLFLDAPLAASQWAVDLQPKSFRERAWLVVSNVGITLPVATRLIAHKPASDYKLVYKGVWPPIDDETVSLYRPK